MLLHPQQSARTRLTCVREGDYQSNAVDIRLDRVWKFNQDRDEWKFNQNRNEWKYNQDRDEENLFIISDDKKIHAKRTEIFPDYNDFFQLQPGCYEICFENQINVAEGEVGWVITRSTLNRNGAFITSGLYDSGYNGPMAGALHISIPTAIKKGTRIGQYLIMSSESEGVYNGDYGRDNKTGNLKAMNKHLG